MAPVLTPGSIDDIGGGGVVGIDDPAVYATTHGADEGYDAEFDGAALPAGWSTINGGTSVVTVAHGLAALAPQAVSDNARVVARTMPAEARWVAEAKVLLTGTTPSGTEFGLILVDTTNSRLLTVGWHPASQVITSTRRNFTGWIGAGPASWDGDIKTSPCPTYFRVDWNAGNVLLSISTDGWNWSEPQAGVVYDADAHLLVPSHVGFYGTAVTGNSIRVSCEWFRVRTP